MRWLKCVLRLPDAAGDAKLFFPLASGPCIAETILIHRRRFLAATALASIAPLLPALSAEKDHPLVSFDRAMEDFMTARKIPGGTRTLLVRRWDGLSWAVLFNQRQDIPNLPDSAIDPAMHRAAEAVKEWPKEDLFPKFAA